MPKIHFNMTKIEGKNFPTRHLLDIFVDGDAYANYEAKLKTDLSNPVYKFYEKLGIEVKPVFGGVDFPDCEASIDTLRELTGKLSDFRIWNKRK